MARPLSKRPRQWLDVLHYATSVGWLGVGFCQLTMDLVDLSTSDNSLRHSAHELAHTFDLDLLLPLALLSFGSGVLRAVRSKWGLLTHWWVTIKLVLTSVLIVGDPLFLGAWNASAIDATSGGLAPGYGTLRTELIAGALVNISVLTVMTALSVIKPWGRIRPRT